MSTDMAGEMTSMQTTELTAGGTTGLSAGPQGTALVGANPERARRGRGPAGPGAAQRTGRVSTYTIRPPTR